MTDSTTTRALSSPDWVQGYAAAVADLARTSREDTLAKELMIGAGITLSDLVDAEVEAFDFDPIRRVMQLTMPDNPTTTRHLTGPEQKTMHRALRQSLRLLCEECGKFTRDPPSHLCPVCQAYKEHTA